MQRRLRITLVVTAAAGVAVIGAGTAYADGIFTAPSQKYCSRAVEKDKPQEAKDFPSYGEDAAESNATRRDLRDSNGDVYAVHNQFCDAPRPWRGNDWHDKSYDTFHYKRESGSQSPSSNHDENTYSDRDGYNRQFRKDKEKKHEPDHVGAPKNPTDATE